MDVERIALAAEISKINFLLENLYAIVLRDAGASHADIPELAEEVVRQAGLPGTVYGSGTDPETTAAIREMVGHRIAMFFSQVQERLRSAGL